MANAPIYNSNKVIETLISSYAEDVERDFDGDVLSLTAPMMDGVDDAVKRVIESLPNKKSKLVVILETRGGYIEAVQRMADVFRHHYGTVEFVVPNFAMSAGTILVMSGDVIHMDYYSVLGPIDPQVERVGSGRVVPALGYLEQYNRLIDKSKNGTLTDVEAAFFLQKFDPAELFFFEQAREGSITLLKDWLVRYKFKNWNTTRTRGLSVSEAMKKRRAAEIAKILNNVQLWHSHSRGISLQVLRDVVRLEVEDFGNKEPLNSHVKAYYNLLSDYMTRVGTPAALQMKGMFVPLTGVEHA